MKHIKPFKINENKIELDEIEANINDILYTLKDLDYSVIVNREFSRLDSITTFEIKIEANKINIDDEFINCLKELVLYMNIYEYNYSASYYSLYSGIPEKFYIYTDSRGLRVRGNKMDHNWLIIRKMVIHFHKYKYIE